MRITEFPGADRCACCGTHVAASGQVGLVKFLSCQKLRDGVRLELLCGGRAMEYLSRCWDQSRRIGQALSVKPQAAFPAVQRLEEQLRQSRERCAALEEQVFRQTAEQYRNAGDVLLVQPDMEPDSVRRLCDAVSGTCRRTVRRICRHRRQISLGRYPSGTGSARLYPGHEPGSS